MDHVNQRLFVVDSGTGAGIPGTGSQIMVFDIHPDRIRTGESVIGVLGQPDAGTKSIGRAANHVARGPSVAVDDANQRLFVGDGANHRALVQGRLTREEFRSRLRQYEALLEPLQGLFAAGCHWGDERHVDIWVDSLERIINPSGERGGPSIC